ncbi:MAG: hypothetical protein ABEJ36_06255 [Candidatus Nanosalina sp.]
MNPDTEIYGLGEDIKGVEKLKDAGMEHLHVIDDKDSEWKWMNGDLAVLDWFREKGKHEDFDMLHIVEWDLLLTAPLDDLYGDISKDALGLSGLKPINEAREYGWPWITGEYREDWEKLREWVQQETGYTGESYGCIFPACCLPRNFLEQYAQMNIPEYSNDEVRVPLIAVALGFDIERTGFYPEWGNSTIKKYFNATGDLIEPEDIKEQLSKPEGKRVFHPARDKVGKEKLMEWKS